MTAPVLGPVGGDVADATSRPADAVGTGRSVLGRPVVLVVVAAVLAALVAVAVSTVRTTTPPVVAEPQELPVSFPGDDLAVASDWGNLDHFGVAGSHIVIYRHDEVTTLALPWDGPEVADVALGDDDIHLLTVTGTAVADGQLTVDLAFGNCRFFHERALDIFTGLTVTAADGGLHPVVFDRPVLVHSPMLASCPDRTLDRGDDARSSGRRGT